MKTNYAIPVLLSHAISISAFPFLASKFAASPLSRAPNRRSVPAGPVVSQLERRGAEPYDPQYPYTGAKIDGLPGTGKGGVLVPNPNDKAHQYQDPPAGAARGPCPGLNAAANHGFLSRDGITTFNELVAAQQNVYNVGWDLAVVLATDSIVQDGDVVTLKLSLGGDRTSQTSLGGLGGLLGREPGLNGHLRFESDTSLTRNDYYLADGDDYSFNGTLFKMMTDVAKSTSSVQDPLYDFKAMSTYRGQRYDQSLATNPHFFFGPFALLLYGAASFLYELMPSQNNNLKPDYATISTFFGAIESDAANAVGGYIHVPERIPVNWTNRATPYTLADVLVQIVAQYAAYPKLFGGNVGLGNFDGLGFKFNPNTTNDAACLLQQALLANFDQDGTGIVNLPSEILNFLGLNFGKTFGQFGCPAVSTYF